MENLKHRVTEFTEIVSCVFSVITVPLCFKNSFKKRRPC